MYIIGSARVSENGTVIGRIPGDQTGKEVAEQEFYVHEKGWIGFAPISLEVAQNLAYAMRCACRNDMVGYTQDLVERLGVFQQVSMGKKLKDIDIPCGCDCSLLIRACVFEATGRDLGNFNTAKEPDVLKASKLFKEPVAITKASQLTLGMILCTKTKGHTAIVTELPKTSSKLHSNTIVRAEDFLQAGKNAALIGKYVVTVEEAMIKDGPSTVRKVLAIAPRGAILSCHGFHLDKWLYVEYEKNGTYYQGYVLKSKLKRL